MEAAAAFEAALELAPAGPAAAEVALAHARALELGRDTDAALKAYSRLRDRYETSKEAALAGHSRARLLGKAGRHSEAAGEFDRLNSDERARNSLSKSGVNPDALLAEWGWSLIDAEKPAEADRVFARLLKDHPDSPFAADARFNLAESANLAHNHAEVVRLLSPLAAGPPTQEPIASTTEGKSSGTKAGPAGPADSLRRLLPAVLYRLGRTHVELKDWEAASVTLDRLLAEFPENPYRREAQFLRASAPFSAVMPRPHCPVFRPS